MEDHHGLRILCPDFCRPAAGHAPDFQAPRQLALGRLALIFCGFLGRSLDDRLPLADIDYPAGGFSD